MMEIALTKPSQLRGFNSDQRVTGKGIATCEHIGTALAMGDDIWQVHIVLDIAEGRILERRTFYEDGELQGCSIDEE